MSKQKVTVYLREGPFSTETYYDVLDVRADEGVIVVTKAEETHLYPLDTVREVVVRKNDGE